MLRFFKKSNSNPLPLHERFPQILDWEVGDRISQWTGGSGFTYQGVNDKEEIILGFVNHNLLFTMILEKEVELDKDFYSAEARDGVFSATSNKWTDRAWLYNFSLRERKAANTSANIRTELSNSIYNEFLKIVKVQTKELYERMLIG